SAARRRPLRSGCDALCASLRSSLHFPERRPQTEASSSTTKQEKSRCAILLRPPEIFFSLAPRGASGERDGERGIQQNGPPLPNPLLLSGRRGSRSPLAAWWL